jgi:rubrerythrin
MTRLERQPTARPRTLHELMSIAAAMESEAVRRYGQLAADMTKRGDHGLAATFQAMLEEERDHLDGIERWSRAMTGLAPAATAQVWQLPAEIARSWDEIAESAVLTPYQALSVAVLNEERGFAFYSYLAATAEDDAVRAGAERLAAEELNHAALLRRERRRAFRREQSTRRSTTAAPAAAGTEAEFARSARRLERDAALLHTAIAKRLSALYPDEDAAVLAIIAAEEREAERAIARLSGEPDESAAAVDVTELGNRTELLRAALAASERLYDFYADAADRAGTEALLLSAQNRARRAVHQIARLAAMLHRAA